MEHVLSPFDTPDGYRRLFTSLAFWSPYVLQVCLRHRLLPCRLIRGGVAGTYPTFIVDERWVVKFFGRMFEGDQAYSTEREVAAQLAIYPDRFTPALLQQGSLLVQDIPWHYLVFEFVPGLSLGEGGQMTRFDDLVRIARDLGIWVRWLHNLPLPPAWTASWEPYTAFLNQQSIACAANQRVWGTLPRHLVEQINDFLSLLDGWIDLSRPPHLIHADLTRDHLLGRLESGRWRSLALIDFGDAMIGDLYYELVALHLDLFRADLRLLGAFMDAYGWQGIDREQFPRRALAAVLLHRFDVLTVLPPDFRLNEIETLEQLANRLFQFPPPDRL